MNLKGRKHAVASGLVNRVLTIKGTHDYQNGVFVVTDNCGNWYASKFNPLSRQCSKIFSLAGQ